MNNTFNITRFKNLLVKDGKMYFRNFGTGLIVFCSLNAILWILNLIFDTQTEAMFRYSLLGLWATLAMMLAPSRVYGRANLSNEGVSFAMLPVSSLEKFLSMLLYCAIVTPAIVFFGGYLIDTLLSLFPFGGFNSPMPLFTFNEVGSMINDNKGLLRTGDLGIDTDALFPIVIMRISFYVGIIQWAAIFMLGNMLFKKHKTGKTFACYLGIGFLLSTILGVIINVNEDRIEQWAMKAKDYSVDQIVHVFHNWMIGGLVVSIVITILLLFFTYRKIKTQKY